jgi:hypothetical protein
MAGDLFVKNENAEQLHGTTTGTPQITTHPIKATKGTLQTTNNMPRHHNIRKHRCLKTPAIEANNNFTMEHQMVTRSTPNRGRSAIINTTIHLKFQLMMKLPRTFGYRLRIGVPCEGNGKRKHGRTRHYLNFTIGDHAYPPMIDCK